MEWEKLNLTVSKERASKKRLSGEAYDITTLQPFNGLFSRTT